VFKTKSLILNFLIRFEENNRSATSLATLDLGLLYTLDNQRPGRKN